MRETFDVILRAGSEELAAQVVPVQAGQLRAASDRRQRRNLAVSGLLAVAILVTGGTYAALGHPGLGGTPRPATAALRAPGPYYQVGQLNPVTMTVHNPGGPRVAIVTVRFGGRSDRGNLVQVQGRSGSWSGRPVTRSGQGGYQSRFPVQLSTGTDVLRLRIQPGSGGTVAVRLSSGGVLLAGGQEPAYIPVMPAITDSGASGPARHLVLRFDTTHNVRVTGPTPPVRFTAYAGCLSGCSGRAGVRLQWLDGASWRSVPVSLSQGSALETRFISPRSPVTIRLRIIAVPGSGSVRGAVALGASEPGLGGTAVSEYFRIRRGLVQLVGAPRQQATIASIRSSFIPGSQPGTGQVLLATAVTAGQHSYRTPAFAAGQVSVWMVCAGGGRSALGEVQVTQAAGRGKSPVDEGLQCGSNPGLSQDGPFDPGAQPGGMKVVVTVPRHARVAVLITRA